MISEIEWKVFDLRSDLAVSSSTHLCIWTYFHVLLGAGIETVRNVPADISSFTIDGLQSDSAYTVLVSPLIGSREGSPSTLVIRTGTRPNLSNTHYCFCPQFLLGETWLWIVGYKIEYLIDCFVPWPSESDQTVVGTVTSLQVQETRGEVVRVSWVGVQGATAYRVSWRRTDGNLLLVHL